MARPLVRLFVYGSLQRGYSNERHMAGARWLGAARTSQGHALVRYVDGYPALHRQPSGRGSVRGELYELDEDLLAVLDAFEEVPTSYQREEIELEDGTWAHAYLIPSERAASWPAIASGHYSEQPALPDAPVEEPREPA